MTTREMGLFGEAETAKYLWDKGYQVIAHQYRCRFGEIDLVARRKKQLCIVEVKLRSPGSFGLPREAVDAAKQEKLRKTALCYLAETKQQDMPVRFDVAEVYVEAKDLPKLERIVYIENAF